MTELNYAFISENRKEVDKSLDWSYIDWHDKKMVKGTDAQTQTQHVHSKDIDTQTTNPCTMRINFDSTSSGMKLGSVTTSNCTSGDLITQEIHRHSPAPISPSQTQRRMPLPLHTPNFHRHSPACCSTSPALWRSSGMSYSVDFHRHSPTRISTSPTLRRMRSTRIYNRETSNPAKPLREESSTPMSPHSSFFREKSPLAADEENKSPESSVTPGTVRTHRSQTLDNGSICKSKESCDSKKPASDKESTTDDNEQVKDPCHKRLKERRRSSVVVSLPGLDVSPGDLFVSNGAADMLNKSDYSEKKSKWPFSRRSTQTKVKTRSGADIDKCLASVQVPEWRDTDFQTFKDMSLVDFLQGRSELKAAQHPMTYKTQEAIWELFTSECVYFLDQLMVLKEVFLTTLSDLQTRQCLQDIDSWRLFANLNELCLVSFGFLTSLLRVIKEMWTDPDSCSTQSLHDLFRKAFSESICHCLQKYCLNYSTAILYLDSLKLREDFGSFVKWCERNEECRRLQLKDLLVVPLQRFTRYPLLLKNIGKRSCSKAEENTIQSIVDLVDRAIYDLEGKVKWLDNYQKVKQLKETLVWLPVWESDKRAHVPESLKHLLKPVTLENLVINRSLLHDGKLFLIENTKQQEVYLFLFDEFLLITKIKRNKKKSGVVDFAAGQELELLLQEGCSFTVLDQPISLDRLQLKNIDQLNATASTLPNSFIIMHQNRYQQCIAVFVLQAQSESTKKAWMLEIEKAVSSLLKQDSLHPRVNNSFHYTESSQI